MADNLTPQQRQAVEDRGGRLLVSAAAGSGKTKVLVDRLMGYINDPIAPANIDDFLMITYTKAAAAELRGKIASKLSEKIAQEPDNHHLQRQLQRLYLAKISTVHSFCGDILRENAYKLNIPGDFRVADENECAELRVAVVNKVLDRAYDSAAENPCFCAFVDSQGLGRNDSQIPEIILKVYDSARCHLDPEKWLDKCTQMVASDSITDASKTEFGGFLISRLHSWLDLQIPAMERCAALAFEIDPSGKAGALLKDTAVQLSALRQCSTWDAVMIRKDIDFGTLRFTKKCSDDILADRIKAVRESCKKGLVKLVRPFADGSSQVLVDLKGCAEAARGLVELVEEFGKEYDRAKRSRRILDFGDLEHKMLDLLLGKSRCGPTIAAAEVGSRFREIMVDEYQDSNAVQDAIYDALSAERQNLFMVGDVKQSIYQFRLADPGIFLKKYRDFVPAGDAKAGQGRKVMLSRNFRSGGGVLAAANDVFRTCMSPEVGGLYYGPEEALYEGISHTPLNDAETELYCIDVQEDTYAEEAAFVADRIHKMISSGTKVRNGDQLRAVRPEDIVILLRSPGSVGGYFQRALEQRGIRCASGGGVDLLQTEEISSLRSLLQVVHNPRLDIPLIGAMASPIFGFSADDLAAIRAEHKFCSFFEAVQHHKDQKTIRFLQTLQQLRSASRKHKITGLLEEIWFRTAMDDAYDAMDRDDLRRENLQIFFQLAAEFEMNSSGDLGRFLEYLDNMEEQGLITTADHSGTGAVTIMSIHKSKGLEFPVVFLCGLGREFNMESQRANVLCHKDMGLGLAAVDTDKRIRYPSIAKRAIAAQIGAESISEEMRVLYVAMTRPKDRLIMTYASNRLEKDLTEMVSRMDIGGKEILIRDAVCPGEWVLLTALQRTEAGALFSLGGYPKGTAPGTPPWKICAVRAPDAVAADQTVAAERTLPEATVQKLTEGLSFRYPHEAATIMPSKQTATEQKGRVKDMEAAEDAQLPKIQHRNWRKPAFIAENRQGMDFGSAIHAVMQYIDYACCENEASVCKEVERLVAQKYITAEQGAMTDCGKIAAFFATEIGRKLRSGMEAVREFKFSILHNAVGTDPLLSGEQILLQGVVDCAMIQEDGIIVIDFKTDRVTKETIDPVVERYRPQVEIYADAMAKIYQKPVKKALLYFFQIGEFIQI